MACLDTTFLIDLLEGAPQAMEMAEQLDEESERHSVDPVSAAEVYVGAYLGSARERDRTEELLAFLRWLPFDRDIEPRASRMQATLYETGTPIGFTDCMIAAPAIEHNEALVSIDEDFERVPGLTPQRY